MISREVNFLLMEVWVTALFSFQSFGSSCCLVKIYCYLCKIPMCTIVSIFSIISHACFVSD